MRSTKEILTEANEAIARGDVDGFLRFCADDIEWEMVGDVRLSGKEAVRQQLESAAEPPQFTVTELLADGDVLVAMGEIDEPDGSGATTRNSYCDVWRFRDDLMVELRAFVVPIPDHA